MNPTEIFAQFDGFLAARKQYFEAIVIGGAALACLGIINRETKDCDVLDPKIPKEIERSAQEFRLELSNIGQDLKEDWLNNGPESLKGLLPRGWHSRIVPIYEGNALFLNTLGRDDLLKTKLFAYCDRGQDLQDCVALNPTSDELSNAIEWVMKQDANPGWPDYVRLQFTKLSKRLGHGI